MLTRLRVELRETRGCIHSGGGYFSITAFRQVLEPTQPLIRQYHVSGSKPSRIELKIRGSMPVFPFLSIAFLGLIKH
jgi:hypothetical protein